jgi:hypothetical protein
MMHHSLLVVVLVLVVTDHTQATLDSLVMLVTLPVDQALIHHHQALL